MKEATEAAEAAKIADIERQKQEEQRRQIQDALNRQSYNEFRSYAEQQVHNHTLNCKIRFLALFLVQKTIFSTCENRKK